MFPHHNLHTEIWSILAELNPSSDPWMLMGDFNCILNLTEKHGGTRRTNRAMLHFQNFLNQLNLLSLPASGSLFTWCNMQQGSDRIYERLDRVIVSPSLLTIYPHMLASAKLTNHLF